MTPRRPPKNRILLVPPFIRFLWAAMFMLAVYTNIVGWFAAQDLGDPRWVQFPLIQLGFTVGFIADDLWMHWVDSVAHALHFEDVIDGTCPDTEQEICEAAVWRWYERQGRPWRISPNRKRPDVRFADAWLRMEAYQRAMKAEEQRLRQRARRKNHRV
ncbi:hypothetical protein [Paraburkholderia sp. J63]|uniref:hypothetical protein n=1 Tax=Paraburkholderia sp. J63 TaxID=2805434 RepID=UPI002ABE5366|nr:hypothetical protein [Paraburkholderia sp. J63]